MFWMQNFYLCELFLDYDISTFLLKTSILHYSHCLLEKNETRESGTLFV